MNRTLLLLSLTAICVGCQQSDTTTVTTSPPATTAPVGATEEALGPATFETVSKILKQKCIGCHGGPKKAEGLAVMPYANLMKGGEHGPVIVAGAPENSRIIDFLKGTKKPRMPLNMQPLPDAQIQLIADWIKAGATES